MGEKETWGGAEAKKAEEASGREEIAIDEEGVQRYAGAQFGGGGMAEARASNLNSSKSNVNRTTGAGITEPDIDLDAENAIAGDSGRKGHEAAQSAIQNIR